MAEEPPNLTIEILKQIRDGISRLETNLGSRIDALGSRIDAVHADLQETNSRLGKVELNLERVELAIVRMSKVNDAVLDEQLQDSGKIEALEGRVRALEGQMQELRSRGR